MECKRKKKDYEKPKVIYQKKIESLAAVCDSARLPLGSCRTPGLSCLTLYE